MKSAARLRTYLAPSSLEEFVGLHPWLVDDVVEVAVGLAGTVVVASVPLAEGIGDDVLDVAQVGEDDLCELLLRVGVGSGARLSVRRFLVVGSDSGVLSISHARGSVSRSQRLHLLRDGSERLPVLVLDVLHPRVHVVGEGLVGLEASVDVGAEVITEPGVEDASLVVGVGVDGDSGGLVSDLESHSEVGEHFAVGKLMKGINIIINRIESNRRHRPKSSCSPSHALCIIMIYSKR